MPPRSFRRVLITGIGGSGGSYLAEYIAAHHPEVGIHGLIRHSTSRYHLGSIAGRVQLHEADLLDFGSTFAAIRAAEPDAIFNLAAHVNVRASFDIPIAVLHNNIIGTANLLEAVRCAGITPLIQIASTSEVYGKVDPKDVPIGEEAPIRPANPYAVSKVCQDLLGWVYFLSYQMPIIRTRMFTYLNPRNTSLFATAFARQVARVEAGLASEVRYGNVESVRTLLDARDAMHAYWEAARWCQPGEVYNIGGTTTMKVGEVLERLIAMTGKSIPTRLDPNLLRPADVTLQIPDTRKFVAATGWQPRYRLEESLCWLLDYWREETKWEIARGATPSTI